MYESQMDAVGTGLDILRQISSSFDKVFFNLMNIMYQLFFNVATADIFANDMILKFYGRIQVIIGVFMVFQLTMSILKGIVNPDEFFDDGKGKTNIIQRIIISLVMLALITPISIPGANNEYEKQINNNGILFGTLYSLQHRILSNNTLGRLILGVDSNDATFLDSTSTSDDEDSEIAKASNTFTSTVVKTFYKINLIPKESRQDPGNGKDDASLPSNRVCHGDIDSGNYKGFLTNYKKTDSDFNFIIDSVNNTCDTPDDSWLGNINRAFQSMFGSEHYMIAYTYLLGGIVAIIFSLILLSFSIDVAMRSIKLAILRLIAPIPIISYMNPKSGDSGAFSSWSKTLTSTYIDLFLRLAIIYFAFFLIESLITGGLVINVSDGVVGGLSIIIIFIAIFIFASQAPKFIQEALGIKSDNFSLFGGLGAAVGVLGTAAGAGALAGGIIKGNAHGIATAIKENKERDKELKNAGVPGVLRHAMNAGRVVTSAIGGGMSSAYAGGKALSKKGGFNEVMSATSAAQQKRQPFSTAPRRAANSLLSTIGLDNKSRFDDRMKMAEKRSEQASKKVKAISSANEWIKSEAKKRKESINGYDINGNLVGGNWSENDIETAISNADSSGRTSLGTDVFHIDELRSMQNVVRQKSRNDVYTEVKNPTSTSSEAYIYTSELNNAGVELGGSYKEFTDSSYALITEAHRYENELTGIKSGDMSIDKDGNAVEKGTKGSLNVKRVNGGSSKS